MHNLAVPPLAGPGQAGGFDPAFYQLVQGLQQGPGPVFAGQAAWQVGAGPFPRPGPPVIWS